MISFYPGPSRLDPHIPEYMVEACELGILSENHRSEAFVGVSRNCITLLKEKLSIPEDYKVFFTSSATECWYILSISFKELPACHLFNGAFGEKWFQTASALKEKITAVKFDKDAEVNISEFPPNPKIICHTYNETSNGTALQTGQVARIREQFPEALIMSDVTSSIGGTAIDFTQGDIWFGSVQKCFGLPAGLGVMICSKKAIETAVEIGYKDYYNSILHLNEKMKDWQTPCTPNVLGIYLLMKRAQEMDPVHLVDQRLKKRAATYYDFFSSRETISLLITNVLLRSDTVIAVKSDEKRINDIKMSARKAGFILGNGYGEWSKDTFRIANFPSIQPEEIEALLKFLETY